MIKSLKTFISNQRKLFYFANGLVKHYQTGIKKSKIKVIRELCKWIIKERSFNNMYYAFGLNIAGTKQREFIGKNEFLNIKAKVEREMKSRAANNHNYDVITKDKFYANSVLTANGIDCIENLAVIHNSMVYYNNGMKEELESILQLKYPTFIKNTVMEAGTGLLECEVSGSDFLINGEQSSLEELKKRLGSKTWIIQRKQKAHTEIRKINATALNTTRIVTIYDGRDPVYLTGFQSLATGSATTDSWDKGSIYVGIDPERNSLKKYGYYNPWVENKSRVTEHPDSAIEFAGYKISDLQRAVKLCIKAHSILFFNFIIGWDVALTEEGPRILEANEKPGMNAVQCLDGGLRYKIMEIAENCLKSKL